MKVFLSDSVERDLEEIGDWIARDNPARAISFTVELLRACRAIGSALRSFSLIDGQRDPMLRRCVHGNYLIFYDIGQNAVEILHILHGARDYEHIIFADDDPG